MISVLVRREQAIVVMLESIFILLFVGFTHLAPVACNEPCKAPVQEFGEFLVIRHKAVYAAGYTYLSEFKPCHGATPFKLCGQLTLEGFLKKGLIAFPALAFIASRPFPR
jgi:hypothetical protein